MNKLNISTLAAAVSAAFALASVPAHADGLLGGAIKSIGRTVGGSTGAAISSVGQAGDDTSRNLQHGNVGAAIQNGGQVIMGAGGVTGGMISDAGRATSVPAIRQVANAVASTVTIDSDNLATTTIVAGGLLQGQDPREIYAAPLATALYQARNAHIRDSHPIPDSIKEALRGSIPGSVLERARYTVGDLEITISNVIGRVNYREPYAVTVDNVIVFNEEPSDDPDDEGALHWWAHELTHVWQYSVWGVPRFAMNYINNYPAVEHEADARADRAVAAYNQ